MKTMSCPSVYHLQPSCQESRVIIFISSALWQNQTGVIKYSRMCIKKYADSPSKIQTHCQLLQSTYHSWQQHSLFNLNWVYPVLQFSFFINQHVFFLYTLTLVFILFLIDSDRAQCVEFEKIAGIALQMCERKMAQE